ncbi:DinB family protein [Salinimicrobium soli]|uniref:DinB family protein n=1 Tax=Salinimicrobium soli TaxID=1254399 RepID=UPI003AAD747F
MKTASENLITDLIERTRQNLNRAQQLNNLSLEILNHKSSADNWSALECLEHLNFYGDFYLPEIENRIKTAHHSAEPNFKAGMLGDYFAKMMLPGESMKPMKTMKSANFNGGKLGKQTLEKFIEQQKKMLWLLDSARSVSLNRTKTSISIAPVIKLKLGDTFRVVIYHNERHLQQAQRAVTFARSVTYAALEEQA